MKRYLLIACILSAILIPAQKAFSEEEVYYAWRGVTLKLKSGKSITGYKWWLSSDKNTLYDISNAMKEKSHTIIKSLYRGPKCEQMESRRYHTVDKSKGVDPIEYDVSFIKSWQPVVRTYKDGPITITNDEIGSIEFTKMEFDGYSNFDVGIIDDKAIPLLKKEVFASKEITYEFYDNNDIGVDTYNILLCSHNQKIGNQELDEIVKKFFSKEKELRIESRLPIMKELASKKVTIVYSKGGYV